MRRPWKLGLYTLVAATLLAGLSLLINPDKVKAANPTTMSFQGKVVNANGTNVADGTYSFLFKLYTVSSGGVALWTETQSSVTVTAGVFQVDLGSSCPFFTANACNGSTPIDFSTSNSLYLGITFNSDPAGEMNPRVQLQSVPYAFQADNASKLGGLAASSYVQLSPGSQQSGNINVSGNGTFGGTLSVTSTINGATISGGTLSGSTLSSSALTFSAASAATIQPAASQALNITGHAASTFSTDSGTLTVQGGSGTVSLGTSTIFTNISGGLTVSSGGTGALTLTSGSGNIGTGSALLSTNTITGTTVNGTTGINTGASAGTQRIDSNGNLTNIGTIAAANGTFNVNASGDQTAVFTALNGTSTSNGTSGIGTSTSLVLTSAANFDVGNYVQVNDTNCGGTGINPCYAKITAKATNTLTITPALRWTNGVTVNEYHLPEVGGTDLTQTLANRYGRGYFIAGVAAGNGTTYYNEDSIDSSLTSFNLLTNNTTTINIGGASTTSIVLGAAGTTVGVSGGLNVTGNVSAGSNALQGGSISINSDTFAVNSAGAITASTGIANSGGYVQTGSTTNTFTGLLQASGGLTVTGTTTLSTLNSVGVLHTSGTGVLSTSAVVLGTDTSGNYIQSLGTLTGLTANSSSGVGISPTLSVTYGSGANTAVQGNVSLVCPSGTGNLSGTGNTITLGTGGTCNSLTVVNSPSFSGSVTAGTGLTVTTGGASITGAVTNVTNLSLSGTISGGTTITGTTLNGTVGINTGAVAGTQRIDASGNLVNIGNITGLGAIILQPAAATALTITGHAASTFSTDSGTLTLQGGSGTVSLGTSTILNATGALTIDSGAATALGFGTGASAKTLTFGNVTGATGLIFNSGTNGVIFNTVASGQLKITSNANVPSMDQLLIDNTGSSGVVTSAISGLQILYKGGAAAIEASGARIDLTTGTTAGGIWNALRLVGAAPTSGVTERLLKGELPAFTQTTAATTTISGFSLASAGALVQNTAAGVIDWDGIAVNLPTITQTTGTVRADGIQVTIPSSAITTGGTMNGINIPAITTGPASGTLNGISIGAITTPGAGTETGLLIGNGWDRAIDIGTGLIRSNALNGITVGACGASQYLGAARVSGGVMTAGVCTNDATGLSDIRTKTNISSLGSVLDSISNINTYSFNYKCNDPEYVDLRLSCDLQTGVIAQELQQVFPNLVTQRDDGLYEVNYRGLSVYTLQAVVELAKKVDSHGNANLNVVTASGLHITGDMKVDGNLVYSSYSAPVGDFSNKVITPRLISDGALVINSGPSGDVTLDSGGNTAVVNIGTSKATEVNIASAGSATNIKGAIAVDGAADFKGDVTMRFSTPETSFKIDNAGNTQTVGAAIQINDSGGAGYNKLISTANFNVAGNGDIETGGAITSKGGSIRLLDAAGQQIISFGQSGTATLNGNLNLASASLSGGLDVAGDVNVAGLSTFQKLATFIGKTIFRQDVQFEKHIAVSKDTAGYALIKNGESTVHVTFTSPYDTVPIISATPTDGQFAVYTVDAIKETGFDIKTQAPVAVDTRFSWTALGGTDPQTAINPPASGP